MSDQTARRVAIQHKVCRLVDEYRGCDDESEWPATRRLGRLTYALGEVAFRVDPEWGHGALERALIRLQAEAQLWSESLMSEAAK